MFNGKIKIAIGAIVTAMVAAMTGEVRAAIVASYAGPGTFNGVASVVTLPNVSIGQEGRVDLQFKAGRTDYDGNFWYLADSPGGTEGEYRLGIAQNHISAFLWAPGGYELAWDSLSSPITFTDTASWHTLSLAWKNGEAPVVTLDSVSYTGTVTSGLQAFTSNGEHVLGEVLPLNHMFAYDGQLRNVVVQDTYVVPEPAAFGLLALGGLALLRRRRG